MKTFENPSGSVKQGPEQAIKQVKERGVNLADLFAAGNMGDIPQTGDGAHPVLWIGMILLGLMGIGGVIVVRRRK